MKKRALILAAFVLGAFAVSTYANEPTIEKDKPWDFFGVSFVRGVPSSSNEANIGGIRIGLPVAGGLNKVYGIEVGAACSWTSEVVGVQTAPLFCVADELTGLQASPVTVAEKVVGLQFGLVNIADDAKFQLGIVNYMRDGILPFTIILNFKF